MKRTLLTSERGISLLRIVLILALLFIVLPAVYNVISRRVPLPPYLLPSLVENIRQRTIAVLRDLRDLVGEVRGEVGGSVRRVIRAGRERWLEVTERVPPLPPEVGADWAPDMERLIEIAEENNFNLNEVKTMIERFRRENGENWWQGSNWWRVEKAFWKALEDQTFEEIRRSLDVFQVRALGCSDFTPLVRRVELIVENFNQHTLEGYIAAKQESQQLREFRVEDSKEFTTELLSYLNKSGQYLSTSANGDWFQKMMLEAIDKRKPRQYPTIVEQIDLRANLSNNLLQRAFADTVVAEIYLNYDLMRPSEDRYEEAIRALTKQVQFLPNNIDLHMALGLLHERVCKNTDLAIKEFKDVVALARQANRECEYAVAHFHLGLLYLNIRPRPVVETTPIPPTPGVPVPPRPPAPTPFPREERRPERRAIAPERAPERRPERPRIIQRNVRPRQRISEAKGILFRDFADISVDSAREFEEFLICQAQGVQARNAEYFHQKYIEAIRRQ